MNDTEALKALVALHKERGSHSHGDESRVEQEHRYQQWVNACYEAMPALERMLASQTQDMVLVPREPTEDMLATARFRVASMDAEKSPFSDMCKEAYKAMLSAAPVASQMGEPIYQCKHRASIGASSGWEDCSKEQYDNEADWDRRILYAAPAAGMDADKIARDIVETYICTKRAENYESSVAEIAAIIRKHQK